MVKIIKVVPLIVVLFLCTTASVTTTNTAQAKGENKFRSTAEMTIYNANYGDYDNDSAADDINLYVSVKLILPPTGTGPGANPTAIANVPVHSYYYLLLETPSGLKYDFALKLKFEVSKSQNDVKMLFTVYNSAIEGGYYTAWLTGIFITRYYASAGCSSIFFDPPTGTGEGANPTAVVNLL